MPVSNSQTALHRDPPIERRQPKLLDRLLWSWHPRFAKQIRLDSGKRRVEVEARVVFLRVRLVSVLSAVKTFLPLTFTVIGPVPAVS